MKRIITIAIPFALTLATLAPGPSALAQGMSGKMDTQRATGPGYEVTAGMQRYREMGGVMRDLSKQMSKMEQDMAKGEMSLQKRKLMKQKLVEMSDLTKRMSGLIDRPSMNDPEIEKQTAEMRKQMDTMMRAQP